MNDNSEIRDEEAWDRLWHTAIHDKWGEIMDPLMEFNEDGIAGSAGRNTDSTSSLASTRTATVVAEITWGMPLRTLFSEAISPDIAWTIRS